MSLLTIPTELLHQIARCLLRCPTCHCHHITWHLSALSRSNRQMHALLAEYLLTTAPKLHMLLWGITNSRHDIVKQALARGADPNSPMRPNPYMLTTGDHRIGTPIDIAIRMRDHSVSAESHVLKLGTVALLFAAGATCTADNLNCCTRYGDLDLLTLCLEHMSPINRFAHSAPAALLEIAMRYGHVEATRLLIGAGAPVNSDGTYPGMSYYPPLWIGWDSTIAVVEVLLEAGADPCWVSQDGVSIVQNMRQRSGGVAWELDEKVALLVRYGAVDETALWQVAHQWLPPRGRQQAEYRGWIRANERPLDWLQSWVLAGLYGGCGCLSCQLQVTGGGYSIGRRM